MEKMENHIDTLTLEFETKVTETTDDFIFTTIRKWMESERLFRKCAISKRILIRAMHFYMTEHADEYKKLSLECADRLEAENDE